MYYVYKVHFEKYNATYIGCTNNIRRRKDQHNGNARTGRSFFGRFLSSAGIVLSESDFEVVAEFNERAEALKVEREMTLSLNGTGVLVLNDVYSDRCTRKGLRGARNPSSKRYVLVDTMLHTTETVDDMHSWCDNHDVSYKTLVGTAKRKPHIHKGRYLVRHIEEWESMSDEERQDLVSGDWYTRHLEENLEKHVRAASKRYLVMKPDGESIEVTNLDKFARENGINCGNLHATLGTNKKAAGYRVLERLS